ncbi:MAG: hypothetical protein ACFBZ8_12395 [Opitutales bacterium]
MACLAGLAPASLGAFLWIEGEAHDSAETTSNAWWEAVRKDGLSGGAKVASFKEPDQAMGRVTYSVEIPESGSYTLWVRGAGNGFTYAVNGEEAGVIKPRALRGEDNRNRRTEGYVRRFRDERNLALDGGTGGKHYAWLKFGSHDLDAGTHTLTFLLGDPENEKPHAAIDCFVLTTEGFEPNGQYRPGETNPNVITQDASKMWPFEPSTDPLSEESLLDLRYLNEDVAGQSGFVRLSEDGHSFVRADGQPLRFWAGTNYNQRSLSIDEMKRHAEFLAKRGVNVIRWHGDLAPQVSRRERRDGKTVELNDVDEKELDEAFKLVAGMKEAGIYTILSPYWGSHTRREANWEIPNPVNGNLAGLVFFVPEVQEAYKGYLRALYTRPNPYTGVPLKDEPAVAVIQLQNEDSMLFFTFQNVRGEAEVLLKQQFRDWLIEKYGSIEKTKEAWHGYRYDFRGEDWKDGLPAIMLVWEFSQGGVESKGDNAGFLKRRADQLEFFARTMYNFNTEIARFLREDLGAPQLINAGNWKTVDPVLVSDAERWSYTANEVSGKNHYFGALHTGRTRGWQILPDHIYTNKLGALSPREFPTNARQTWGHPFIIPESLWVPPNRYESEGPLVVASQQSVNGVDAFFWFATGKPEWIPAVQGGRNSSLTKWTFATPMQLGQFPASALLYRTGMLQEADPVIVERRSLENIWDETLPLTAESASFDPNRDQGLMAPDLKLESPIDPLAFLVGPVLVEYGADPSETEIDESYREHIDHEKAMVRSSTGEVEIHHERGLYLIKSPRVQAASGYLGKAEGIDLGDVKLSVKNEYAAITTVALDEQPLKASKKVLVQIGTYQEPNGWKTEKINLKIEGKPMAAQRIMETGETPWMIRRAEGVLWIRNAGLKEAVVLDANGLPRGEADFVKAEGDWMKLTLPEDALYVVLRG